LRKFVKPLGGKFFGDGFLFCVYIALIDNALEIARSRLVNFFGLAPRFKLGCDVNAVANPLKRMAAGLSRDSKNQPGHEPSSRIGFWRLGSFAGKDALVVTVETKYPARL
jgi:hypothetical protein